MSFGERGTAEHVSYSSIKRKRNLTPPDPQSKKKKNLYTPLSNLMNGKLENKKTMANTHFAARKIPRIFVRKLSIDYEPFHYFHL